MRTGLVGQRLEQLEQLGRRRVRGQGDFPDAMKVETLHQHRHTLSLTRHAIHLDAAPSLGQPQGDGRVLEQAQQGAELLLLLGLSGRVAEQAHTVCEPRGEVIEGRHGGRSI